MKSEQDFDKSVDESVSQKNIPSTSSLKSETDLLLANMLQMQDFYQDAGQVTEEDLNNLKKVFADLRDFKLDKENKLELVKPTKRTIIQAIGLWKKRPIKHINYKMTLILQQPQFQKEKILQEMEVFASIKLIIDGEEFQSKKATHKMQNGAYYEGIDGEYMMITKTNSDIVDYFEGMTKDFVENGKGIMNHIVSGKTVWQYCGDFVDGKREGKGREISGKGVSYEGEFKNDYKHGQGTELVIKRKKKVQEGQQPFVQKNRYVGEFQQGYKQGIGTQITPHGQYHGEWHQGMKHGKGTIKYKKGDTYEGEWQNNCQHGEGVYTEMVLVNDEEKFNTYTGEFKEGYYHGKGVMEYFNGDKYEGEWAFGKKEGEGMYNWSDGDYYDGHWEKDSAEGTGAACFGGVFYDGEFHLGEKHGLGQETDEEGNTLKAMWQSGKIIKKLEINGEIIQPEQQQN